MKPSCPKCNLANRISHVQDYRKTLESEWTCSRCGRLFRFKHDCYECADWKNHTKESHCVNNHRFSIYHDCAWSQGNTKGGSQSEQ